MTRRLVNALDMLPTCKADGTVVVTDNEIARLCLRPLRGCATDEQYADAHDRITAELKAQRERDARIVDSFARADHPNAVTVCDLAATAIRKQ